ncbi:hypothetical protein [Pseudogulbenkiania sp. MAI-1]|uniref:hypothetical protein n=1 Tax=Pseudogulbenkiania sp. MAI-1 TaxID=990370 RepID=UPI00045E750E|nr:hypothetical protein [Pseudogulbenkiania sp. MAI-1]
MDRQELALLAQEFCRLTGEMRLALLHEKLEEFFQLSDARAHCQQALQDGAGPRLLEQVPACRSELLAAMEQNREIDQLLSRCKEEAQSLLASSRQQQRLMKIYRS